MMLSVERDLTKARKIVNYKCGQNKENIYNNLLNCPDFSHFELLRVLTHFEWMSSKQKLK